LTSFYSLKKFIINAVYLSSAAHIVNTLFYFPIRGMEENLSPSGENFSIINSKFDPATLGSNRYPPLAGRNPKQTCPEQGLP